MLQLSTRLSNCYTTSFNNSAVCLTTGPKSLPKRVLLWVRSNTLSFNLQYPFVLWRLSSSCLRLISCLPVTSISPTIPSITCFRKQFLRKMWPIQLAFLLFTVCIYSSPPWLCVTLPHFSHDLSNWSSPSFSSTIFQNFPRIADLLYEVSKIQLHTMLCSKCSTSLVSPLNLSPVC